MFWLRWRGLLVVVVMVMEVTALPQQALSSALKRQKRQGSNIDSISNESLQCLLTASLDNQNSNSCGPTPLDPFLPPPELPPELPPVREPPPPVDPFPPEEPPPPVGPFPPEEPPPPVGPFPPEEPLPPIDPFPPEEPLPPIGPFPPEEPLPPVGPFPPEEPLPPDFIEPIHEEDLRPPLPLPAPPCTCVPHWQCEDDHSATLVEGDSMTSVVLDLRSNLVCSVPEEVCCVHTDPHAMPPKPPAFVAPTCGQRNSLGVSNTFFGFKDQQTQFGEFPWTVVVLSNHWNGVGLHIDKSVYIGGGSLIHPQLVLTVAHKLKNQVPEQLKIRVGEWNLMDVVEPIKHQEIGVAEVLIQPGYSGHPYHYNDLVLLVLERPAVLGPTVNTICLPLTEHDFLHHDCLFTGWGKKNFHDSRFERVMKFVSMPLVDHNTCQAALHQTRLGPRFFLHGSFLCAGGEREGQDACTGDGGSPLVCPLRDDPSRYVQVGVVAWGVECGRLGLPGVYADVVKAGQWIDQILVEKFGASLDIRLKQ